MYVVSWNDAEIARSDHAVSLEGALYFSPESVRTEFFTPSAEASFCEWKAAHAQYFDIQINDEVNRGAVWRYQELGNPNLSGLAGWYSFWRDVKIEWIGSGSPNVIELPHELPNVAKALGAKKVMWRGQPPFLHSDEAFAGYILPEMNIAVDVLADPGPDKRAEVVDAARKRARGCAEYAARGGENGYGYIAVWGSTPPPEEAVEILQLGGSVLALEEHVEQVS